MPVALDVDAIVVGFIGTPRYGVVIHRAVIVFDIVEGERELAGVTGFWNKSNVSDSPDKENIDINLRPAGPLVGSQEYFGQ